ncbi:hypothetical protein H0H92_014698, partial [Tricholoma furcatifolium]
MEFFKPDLWSLGANPPSISSFITLPSIGDGLWSRLEKGPVSTGRCGLGWSFVVELEANAAPYWSRNIKIFIATHAIATSDLGKLSITVTASDDSPLVLESVYDTEICLPVAAIFPLASYHTSEPFKAGAKFAEAKSLLTIRVELPPTFSLSEPIEQRRLRGVLRESMAGSEL